MSILDASLLLLFVATVFGWLFAGARHVVRWAVAPLIVLAIWQVVSEPFTWQFTPLYAGIALLVALAVRGKTGRIGVSALTVLALGGVGAWTVLAVPELPKPSGPYAVGTVTWRWVDASRPEDATDAPDDRRNVVAQAWYPAPASGGANSVYMDGLGRLPARVSLLPGLVFKRFGEVDTHARVAAPVSRAKPNWPVIVFSPGYGAPRAFYTSLVADLASRGFVVIMLDHPYEGPATELADGRLATLVERFLPGDPDRIRYMETRLKPRVGDVRFVIDQLQTPGDRLRASLDLSRLAVVGHSFGGATAAAVLAQDKRPSAGADLDGMLYGGVEHAQLQRPFLFIESDHAVTRHQPLYFAKRDAVLSGLGPLGQQFEITGTNHYSFTDAESFFAPPARPLVRRLVGGSRPSAEAQRLAADRLEAWLRKR